MASCDTMAHISNFEIRTWEHSQVAAQEHKGDDIAQVTFEVHVTVGYMMGATNLWRCGDG